MQTSASDLSPAPSRCAIYTRKSFQPPIGQEITSLESQRTICSSYVASQQHKGWTEIPKVYEDSGLTGANLDRPGLHDLIADIESGLVEIVVVYKLDRISRTLLDFVRLMDFFERYGVVFVAITQNFDTGESMGRLIRNVLLTFAQFEREITSDRMRDKRMVMKQSGRWIGGDAPLGYDLRRRKLVINRLEAPIVRRIFETYVATKRVSLVHRDLAARGCRRKVFRTATGKVKGGGPVSLSSLHHILRNPVYVGQVGHAGERYPGIHEPIIEPELFARTQAVLKEREQFKPRQTEHLLTGILFDSHGRRLYGRHYWRAGSRGGTRFYESPITTDPLGHKIKRSRARGPQLEAIVLEAIKALLTDLPRLRPVLMQANAFGLTLEALSKGTPAAALRLGQLSDLQISAALKALLSRIEVAVDHLSLIVRAYALAKFIGWDGVGFFKLTELELARATRMHVIVIPVECLVSRRRVEWLSVDSPQPSAQPNPSLVKLIRQARRAQVAFFDQRDRPIAETARLFSQRVGSFSRLVRLNYLAPDIVAAILNGTQPDTLTRQTLIKAELPLDWDLQRRLFGFAVRRPDAMVSRVR